MSDPLVIVRWLDHTTTNGWSSRNDEHTLTEFVSVGWVLSESERALTLAPTVAADRDDDRVGDVLVLLKSAIVDRRSLTIDALAEAAAWASDVERFAP